MRVCVWFGRDFYSHPQVSIETDMLLTRFLSESNGSSFLFQRRRVWQSRKWRVKLYCCWSIWFLAAVWGSYWVCLTTIVTQRDQRKCRWEGKVFFLIFIIFWLDWGARGYIQDLHVDLGVLILPFAEPGVYLDDIVPYSAFCLFMFCLLPNCCNN